MRILVCLQSASIGGGQTVALAIAKQLASAGHTLGVLVPEDGPATAGFRDIGVEVHFADIGSLRRPFGALAAGRILRHYDVLYSHHSSVPGEILGEVAARRAGRQHVMHGHTPPHLSPRSVIRSVQRSLYRRLLRRRPFIAVAPHIRRQLIRLGIPAANIEVIPNGVDVDAITPVRGSREGPLRIGVLGRFDPQKGMDTFVEAASLTRMPPSEAVFVLGGSSSDPDFEARVRNRAGEVGVQVEAPGTHGVRFLSRLDVVVMPSRGVEGLPLVLLEAMALGKPVIASDVEGIGEVLGDTGILVEPDDPARLSQAIEGLVRSAETRESLGGRARMRVVERFPLAQATEAAAQVVVDACCMA